MPTVQFHVWIQKFFSWGVQALRPENSLDNVFFCCWSNGFIAVKTILFQGSRGSPTFSRGGPTFSRGGGGGGQMLISIETHITSDFPGGGGGGGGGPDPHLWIHTCSLLRYGHYRYLRTP